MKLVLKTDENGVPVIEEENGVKKPVYVDEESGREMPMDVQSLYSGVTQLKGENKTLKEQNSGVQQTLAVFEGIEDIPAWKKTAEEAIETVANFKDKDLVDAGKVDEIKRNMKTAHATELQTVRSSFENQVNELTDTVNKKQNQIRNLLIGSKFSSSPMFVGEKKKTNLNPKVGESYFGKHFKIVELNDGDLDVVGVNADGSEIYSIMRPGEVASFDEALEIIIDRDPTKNDYLVSAQKTGSGAGGGSGQGGGGEADDIKALEKKYDEAREAGNGRLAITLKNRIHDLRMANRNAS